MRTRARIGIGAMMFAGAIGLVAPSFAQQGGDFSAEVKKIADAIAAGNAAGAKKMAAAAAKKYEIEEIMKLYRPRNKGGLGWGAKAAANPATDGLEKKIEALKKAVPTNFFKDNDNNKESLNWMAAVLEITAAAPAPKGAVRWNGSIARLRVANAALANAVAARNAAAISKAAVQINTACVECHSQL